MTTLRLKVLAVAGALLLVAPAAPAIERLSLEVTEVVLPDGRELRGASAIWTSMPPAAAASTRASRGCAWRPKWCSPGW